MNSNSLRRIRKRLGLKQGELAEKLGVTQQALSSAERSTSLPRDYREKLLEVFPEKRDLILETFESSIPRLTGGFLEQAARQPQEPVPELSPIEDKALPWAVTFRSRPLLDRLAYLARCAGLQSKPLEKLPYGLLFTEGESQPGEAKLGDILFPSSGTFSLKTGTVILLGSPYRHPAALPLLEVLLGEIKVQLEFHRSKSNHFFYFGYPTTFVDIEIEGELYRPSRYVDEQDNVYYEDYGVILHAPTKRFVEEGEFPFGKEAIHAVLVAGSHRLATGTGARLLEDPNLQTLMLEEGDDFEGVGMLAYRVVVRSGKFSAVEELSRIKRWKESSAK